MLEPIPETREALAELVGLEDPDLDERLGALARRARDVVPELVGLSLTLVDDGLTFTLVSSSAGIAGLDATQYLDGGPCVDVAVAGAENDAVETRVDALLDEGRWSLFSQSSAAAGIASSLSMSTLSPIGETAGSINLYASAPSAFEGRHELLRNALGGSTGLMTTDADLEFRTRDRAREAPRQLHSQLLVETAVGLLAARYDETIEQAHHRLRLAARRADVDPALVARVLLLVSEPADDA